MAIPRNLANLAPKLSATGGSFATTIGVGGATPAASGAGITFPASVSASSNANTLDDYEEGTWTPIDSSGAGLTFAAGTAGVYTKIGKLVCIQGFVNYPSTADGSNVKIGGMPFAPDVGVIYRRGNLDVSTETTAKYCFPDETSTFTEVFNDSSVRITNAALSSDNVGFTLIFQVA